MQMLKINMFGEFTMTYGQNTVTGQSSRSKKVWTLLQYLITFRDKEIPQSDLIELLWPNDEIINPANALKTLLYRVRAAISELDFAERKDIIIYRRGSYAWNNDLPVLIDSEEFDKLVKLAVVITDEDLKLDYMLQAIDLYKGNYLPSAAAEMWVLPIAAYYHSIYLKLVHDTISILSASSRYDDIITVCSKAVQIDPYDEFLHLTMIRTLIASGSHQAALQHYNYVTELFYSQFGVKPSAELTGLYREIVSINTMTTEMDLNIIREELRETNKKNGAFYCEYEIFKDIYRLEARASQRSGRTSHIALISVISEGNRFTQIQINSVMERVKHTISTTLRNSDVYTRYSVSQYLLILGAVSYEKSDMIMRRIKRNFKREFPKTKVILQYKLLPLDNNS